MLPVIFIASSVEGLEIARAMQAELEHDADGRVWNQGTFTPSSFAIEALEEELANSDFGIFVFSPDDEVTIRGEKKAAVRDNVVFEIGLFIGQLGRKRCFMIAPKGANLQLPSDLIGLSPLQFDSTKKNLQAAVGSACNAIRKAVKKLGMRDREAAKQPAARAGVQVDPTLETKLSDKATLLVLRASKEGRRKGHVIVARDSRFYKIMAGTYHVCYTKDVEKLGAWKAAIAELLQLRFLEDHLGKGEVYLFTAKGSEYANALRDDPDVMEAYGNDEEDDDDEW